MPWVEIPDEKQKEEEFAVKKVKLTIPRLFMGYPLKETCESEIVFKPFKFELLQGTTTVPLPRSGHRIVCEEGNLYSFGGYLEKPRIINAPDPVLPHLVSPIQTLFQELWELNSLTNEWRHLVTYGEAPKELASHSMILHGHFLVVYGGTGVPFGGCSSNKMHVCDLRTLTWHLVQTSGEFPFPQYGQAVLMDRNDAFYVVGGTTGYDYSIDVHKLDMKTFEWQTLFIAKGDLSEPSARYRHEIALYNDAIYVLGGGTAVNSCGMVEIPTFCLKTLRWTHVQTFSQDGQYPAPRKCHGCVRRGDDLYISGGYNNHVIFDDIWKFNLPTLEWKRLNVTMPVPTYFHATTITPAGCLFIYGGVIEIKKSVRTDKLYKVWLTIPSLKELAWSAVHQYARHTEPSCLPEIITSIPVEFRDRLPRVIENRPAQPEDRPCPPVLPRYPPRQGKDLPCTPPGPQPMEVGQ